MNMPCMIRDHKFQIRFTVAVILFHYYKPNKKDREFNESPHNLLYFEEGIGFIDAIMHVPCIIGYYVL